MNRNQTLLMEITKMHPIEFAGLAKLLGVEIIKEEEEKIFTSTVPEKEEGKKYAARSFTDVLEDVMAKFTALNRTRQREILRLVKKSNSNKKFGGGLNANNS